MNVHTTLPRTQALRIVPGVPYAILCLCRGSLATSVPAKVVGLVHRAAWLPLWPTDLWGTAVIGEATDGDGDENSSRDNASPY
jgi:hypothetical protein